MRVTTKCDVYSFGMVALEVLMGTYPGSFVSMLSSSSPSRTTLVKDMLDHRLRLPIDRAATQIAIILTLAFRCVNNQSKYRPTMKEVNEELNRLVITSSIQSLTLCELMDIEM